MSSELRKQTPNWSIQESLEPNLGSFKEPTCQNLFFSSIHPSVRESAWFPPWGTPYYGLYREAPPERGTVFRLQVYERGGILQVEVYKKVEETFWFCDLFIFLKRTVRFQQLKGMQDSSRYVNGVQFFNRSQV